MKPMGMMLILAGCFLILLGVAFSLGDRIPFLGRLPGDIHIKGERGSFSFPLTTCILLSIILTVLLNLVMRFWKR